MSYVYCFPLEIDTGAVIPSVGKMLDNINASMKAFGFLEQMSIRGHIGHAEITAESLLDDERIAMVKKTFQTILDDKMDVKINVGDPIVHLSINDEVSESGKKDVT